VSSEVLFTLLIAAVAVERLAELVVSKRNAAWAMRQGGVETGRRHYAVMVVLHTGLLVGAVVEVWVTGRPFVAWLGWPMLVLALGSQVLRWWCIRTLGAAWSTRVVVVPGTRLVRAGPYRWLRHPNSVAVVVEGFALPLVHTAWVTAAVFTVADAVLLRVRIRCEDAALRELAAPEATRA
jgi:methyltransferase